MRQFRAVPESDNVVKGIHRFNRLTTKQKRASVVRFVDKAFAHKPENYRKVVVRNMLKDLT
jgi:hypothetical protein